MANHKSLQQILACFEDKTFPTILTLIEQGRFTLGYYQQKAANRQAARQGAAVPWQDDHLRDRYPARGERSAGRRTYLGPTASLKQSNASDQRL